MTNEDAVELSYGFVASGDLLRAIGHVALEATAVDEALREVLSNVLGLNSMLIFEGQSTEWLISTTKIVASEFAPRHKYHETDLQKFEQILSEIETLRRLRNRVVHGYWASSVDDAESTLPRPWGNNGSERTYVCMQSRLRRWDWGQYFTVSDVNLLAKKLHDSMIELIKAFIRMADGRDVVRMGSFARWSLDGLNHPEAAWE